MRAAVCTHHGEPEELELLELPSPQPGPGEISIAVAACGVNFPDLLLVQDKYQFKPPLPFAPGAEVAGVVKEIGPGVTRFRPGDGIVAVVGVTGGYAEEAVAEERRCILMPPGMDVGVAASFVGTYGTSLYALKDRALLQPGETLVVLGAAGGAGLAAVELGGLMGARVIAGVSSQGKLDLALGMGASDGFIYPSGPLDAVQKRAVTESIRRCTDDAGADVLYDPIGGDYAESALRAMKWGGRYLVIGFAAGHVPKAPLNLPLLKGCSIVGVFWGVAVDHDQESWIANHVQLADWIAQGRLAPHISARLPLAEAGKALRLLMERKAEGKIVLLT